MVAELSALQQIITALTGLNGLPAVVVECAVTTIYTCLSLSCLALCPSLKNLFTDWDAALGGFKVSFFTDNIQGSMVVGLIIMAIISIGVETRIDRGLIDDSGFLEPSLLGWQLIYILPVAIFT